MQFETSNKNKAGAKIVPGGGQSSRGTLQPPPVSRCRQHLLIPTSEQFRKLLSFTPVRKVRRGSANSAFRIQGRTPMNKVDRRSALAIGIGSRFGLHGEARAFANHGHRRQGHNAVARRGGPRYSETPAIIPGFKNVQLRDIIMQPGSKTMGPPMENAMGLPYHRRGASDRAGGEDVHGQKELSSGPATRTQKSRRQCEQCGRNYADHGPDG